METTENEVLNVTLIEPRLKHPTIFARFDELSDWQTLTILNDHDPKPLYYQLLGERGNIFTWEYLEQGPEWWRVNISKKLSGESEETLGSIAAADLRKAQVFKKYGLDFCCGGKKTVKEACAEKGIDVTLVEQELQQSAAVPSQSLPYNEWGLDFLADFIVNTHHTYIRKNLPEIRQFAEKVRNVHGHAHPELAKVFELVESINHELLSHMVKEEQVLFPYIKELARINASGGKSNGSPFGTVRNPINMMEMEHELVGENLHEIRKITGGYQLPQDACTTYTLLYKMLQEFEEDLHLHIHLENNILFPKAIDLEKKLTAQ